MPHIFYLEIFIGFTLKSIKLLSLTFEGLIREYYPTICSIRITEVFHK
jgi:hypothetical protein